MKIGESPEGIVPPDHIFGTEFRYTASGEIDAIIRATAGYGKVAVLDRGAIGSGPWNGSGAASRTAGANRSLARL